MTDSEAFLGSPGSYKVARYGLRNTKQRKAKLLELYKHGERLDSRVKQHIYEIEEAVIHAEEVMIVSHMMHQLKRSYNEYCTTYDQICRITMERSDLKVTEEIAETVEEILAMGHQYISGKEMERSGIENHLTYPVRELEHFTSISDICEQGETLQSNYKDGSEERNQEDLVRENFVTEFSRDCQEDVTDGQTREGEFAKFLLPSPRHFDYEEIVSDRRHTLDHDDTDHHPEASPSNEQTGRCIKTSRESELSSTTQKHRYSQVSDFTSSHYHQLTNPYTADNEPSHSNVTLLRHNRQQQHSNVITPSRRIFSDDTIFSHNDVMPTRHTEQQHQPGSPSRHSCHQDSDVVISSKLANLSLNVTPTPDVNRSYHSSRQHQMDSEVWSPLGRTCHRRLNRIGKYEQSPKCTIVSDDVTSLGDEIMSERPTKQRHQVEFSTNFPSRRSDNRNVVFVERHDRSPNQTYVLNDSIPSYHDVNLSQKSQTRHTNQQHVDKTNINSVSRHPQLSPYDVIGNSHTLSCQTSKVNHNFVSDLHDITNQHYASRRQQLKLHSVDPNYQQQHLHQDVTQSCLPEIKHGMRYNAHVMNRHLSNEHSDIDPNNHHYDDIATQRVYHRDFIQASSPNQGNFDENVTSTSCRGNRQRSEPSIPYQQQYNAYKSQSSKQSLRDISLLPHENHNPLSSNMNHMTSHKIPRKSIATANDKICFNQARLVSDTTKQTKPSTQPTLNFKEPSLLQHPFDTTSLPSSAEVNHYDSNHHDSKPGDCVCCRPVHEFNTPSSRGDQISLNKDVQYQKEASVNCGIKRQLSQKQKPVTSEDEYSMHEIPIKKGVSFQEDSSIPSFVPASSEQDQGKRSESKCRSRETTKDEMKRYNRVDDDYFLERNYHTSNLAKDYSTNGESFQIANMLGKLLRQQLAPDVDLEPYDGNPLDYHYFKALFSEIVENNVQDPRGRLTRLIKFTKGDARNLIQHCIQLPSEIGYATAKALLEKTYGDPYTVVAAYRQEIRMLPVIKRADVTKLKQFWHFLIKCQSVSYTLSWKALDNPDTICALLTKLPPFIADRWNRTVLKIRKNIQREADFSDFVQFIEEEATLVNDPMYSRSALETNQVKDRKQNIRCNNTGTDEIDEKKCSFCSENHHLDQCNLFMVMEIEERSLWLKENKKCYGCLSDLAPNHNARSCTARLTCQACGKKHPTSLHGYKFKPSDLGGTVKSNAAKTASEGTATNISMCVVPIQVKFNDKIIQTTAILDSCSQGTFVSDQILRQLRHSGTPTTISVETLNGTRDVSTKLVKGLQVKAVAGSRWLSLGKCFSKSIIKVDKEDIATPKRIERWKYLQKIHSEICQNDDKGVGLLIGANERICLEPIEVIPSKEDGPYAIRSLLGWCVVGPLDVSTKSRNIKCDRILVKEIASTKVNCYATANQVKETGIEKMLKQLYQNDLIEPIKNKVPSPFLENDQDVSYNDMRFLELMKDEGKFSNGHYVLPLPLKEPDVVMPNNKQQALQRLFHLKRRLQKDPKLFENYKNFMEMMLAKGYAQKAVSTGQDGKCWYIPHFSVDEPHKPGKIRIVFDCSASFKNVSLNQNLMTGPDLTNLLLGVLIRFRQEKVAFIGDLEKMFYQVHVPREQRSLLRFLWWPEHDINKKPIELEMAVHLFGAGSSPGVSNYALKRTADDFGAHRESARDTIYRNFYVDDLMKSVKTPEAAVSLINEVVEICKAGGFNLTKLVSNSPAVIGSIPEEKRKSAPKELVGKDHVYNDNQQKALGILWNTSDDSFGFKINIKKDKPTTKRSLLSNLCSIYDPCGFVAPFILKGRKIIQELCIAAIGWDDDIPPEIQQDWNKWCSDLQDLDNFKVARCFKPKDFGNVVNTTLHHFSDASTVGYGQATYLRMVDDAERVHCSFVVGKARVTPSKFVSVPRLELNAAVLSVKVAILVKAELQYNIDEEFFWTDSNVVLSYIKNHDKRFKIYVANRIQYILDNTHASQWFYVESKSNPADHGSRGLTTSQKDQSKMWQTGPDFLWKRILEPQSIYVALSNDDEELKVSSRVLLSKPKEGIITHFEERISSWSRMKRIMAYVIGFINLLKQRIGAKRSLLKVDEIEGAGKQLLLLLQKKYFSYDKKKKTFEPKLASLTPFFDENGIIRVGGRLQSATLAHEVMHPVILPKTSNLTNSIISSCHESIAHGGRNSTLNAIRTSGFWIISANSVVRSFIHRCIRCRFLRSRVGEQIMSQLPKERLIEAPPFSYNGVDLFGPFVVKRGRAELKRYGTMFTCLNSRAVHIEVVFDLSTDTFLLAIRRFIARRGNIRYLRSDNGTNFVGAKAELKKAFLEMDHLKIGDQLRQLGADWEWKNNTPTASHHGGVWERQIRSARTILTSLLSTHAGRLTDESLATLMAEAESIINSRPLTIETLSDVNSFQALSPAMILTQKTRVVLPPPGIFSDPDAYSRRQWRRTQHLCQEFWSRWRKEFLATLTERKKWKEKRRNFMVEDVVILKEDSPRGSWPLARIIEVSQDHHGNVRSVKLKTSDNRELTRPITKIVLLLESEIQVRIPDEEPKNMVQGVTSP